MRIEYTCEDGSRTLALWPSMALLHWLGRSRPVPRIEDPEPFKLYVVGPPVPGDDHEVFLTLVYAEVERRWGRPLLKAGTDLRKPHHVDHLGIHPQKHRATDTGPQLYYAGMLVPVGRITSARRL